MAVVVYQVQMAVRIEQTTDVATNRQIYSSAVQPQILARSKYRRVRVMVRSMACTAMVPAPQASALPARASATTSGELCPQRGYG